MSRPEKIVLVSDLHLGAGGDHDPFLRDRAFVGLCEHLAGTEPVAPGARRLAVLGDFLELLGVRAGDERRRASSSTVAVARLEEIARAHPEVFAAIAELVAVGWDVELLVGNHDIELVRPEVRQRLTELLRPRGSGRGCIRVHPWILHVPGVLYAEHGHQYHDINWFPELAWAAGPGGNQAVRHPLAAHLAGSRPALAGALARHAVGRLLGTRDPRRRRYRREALLALAGDVGLGSESLRQIDLLPAASTASMAVRAASLLARRQKSAAQPSLQRAAADIDRILREDGRGCAVYAFGHSHVAACAPLSENDCDGGPVYVNAGTWSRDVRGPLRGANEEEQATFAVIECHEGARPDVSLRSWRQRGGVVATNN